MGKMTSYKEVLNEKHYMRSLFAKLISRFGDSIDAVAFMWMVYEVTGKKEWSAIVGGLNLLPSILFMPFAGVLVAKMNKKLTVICSYLLRALIVLTTACLFLTGYISPYYLGAATFLMSSVEAFSIPAGFAIYPKLVPREKYTLASSLSASLSRIVEIGGTALAAVLIALVGLGGAMLIDMGAFVVAALIYTTVALPKENLKEIEMNFRAFFIQAKEGFAYFTKKRTVLTVCIFGSILNALFVPFSVLQVPFVSENLKLSVEAISIMGISMGLGMALGAFIFPKVNARIKKTKLFIICGLVASSGYFGLVGISFVGIPLVVYALLALTMLVMGAAVAMMSTIVSVAFMETVEENYLARMGGLFNAMVLAISPPVSFLIAGFAAYVNTSIIFIGSAILAILLFLSLCYNQSFKEIDSDVKNI